MPASIFAGSKVKTLKSTLSLNGGADIISSTTNPQTSAVSAEPGSLLLNTTSGTMYRKLDSGSSTNWVEVGSGGGGKNYIKNPDFDGGATTNWSMQKVSLSSLIPTGNIGAADAGHTISASNSSPLEGANSLLVQGASAFTAGNCLVSKEFAIDREDMAKVMGWSFYYEAVTANMDFTGTSAGTWAVYIAEVTTATPDTVVSWIQPAGVYNLVQGSGVGLASGTFQTTATGTAYRLVLVCINSEAAATTLKVDDFQLGPQKVVYGAPVSDWVSYTPVWTSASNPQPSIGNGSISGRWRRVGDSAEIQLALITGTTTTYGTGAWNFSIPSGLGIDLNKTVVADGSVLGLASLFNAGSLTRGGQVVSVNSTSVLEIEPDNSTGTRVNSTTPFTWASGMALRFEAFVPISGWSSNTVMSDSTDTRVVAARAYSSTAGAWPTSDTVINYGTVNYDSHASITTGAGWNYKIPVSGYYKVSATHEGATSGATTLILRIRKNGSQFATGNFPVNSATSNIIDRVEGQNYFNAGDLVDVVASSSAATGTLVGSASASVFTIERLSGPATIAASETVGCTYDTLTADTVTAAGIDLIYTNKVFDTHGAYNTSTGEYTVPVSGEYTLSGQYRAVTTAMTIGFGTTIFVSIDGTLTKYLGLVRTQTASGIIREVLGGPVTLRLNAGQKIKFRASSDTNTVLDTPASPSTTNQLFNWMSIMRTGN